MLLLFHLAPAQAARDDVLIIVNDNSLDSPEIGLYYARQRGIDQNNIVHVSVPDSYFVAWGQFRNLRDQIIRFMQANTLDDPDLEPVVCEDGEPPYYCAVSMEQLRAHTRIRYLVTTRGVPTRVRVADSALYAPNAPASVDAYLRHWLVNYFDQDVQLKLTERELAFGDGTDMRQVIPALDRELIVGRIDGLTRSAAEALVDRAMGAERDGIYGRLLGSLRFRKWYDHEAARWMVLDGRHPLHLFGEWRPECVDYLASPSGLPEGKTPAHCMVQMSDGPEPAPGNAGSRQPLAIDALVYQGWLDGQRAAGGFDALLNWRRDPQCGTALCEDAPDPGACRAASTDVFKEIDTDCVGVADGFMGYNHQSYPVSYLTIWPTGWYPSAGNAVWNDTISGDVHGLAFPQVRDHKGYDDSYSLWFRNTDQVKKPRCYPDGDITGSPSLRCLDERRVLIAQRVDLAPRPISPDAPPRYRVGLRYRADKMAGPVSLRVALSVHETGGGSAEVQYAAREIASIPPGKTDWTYAEIGFRLDPARHTRLEYDGLKLRIETAGLFAGDLALDTVSLQEMSEGVALIRNGSFDQGHRQVATGDHAAAFLSRLNGTAFWGSVSHHQSGGCAFCNNALELLIYFLRGLPLGDAVWFNESNNSGVLYGDPLYSPVAVRLAPVNQGGPVRGAVALHGSVQNGNDPARVSSSYRVDVCPGTDIDACSTGPGAWAWAGVGGQGGERGAFLGPWDVSALAPGIYTLRLGLTSTHLDTGRTQALYDYQTVTVENPDYDADGDGIPDVGDLCPAVSDPGQTDSDADGTGDACDNCILAANPDQRDTDGDGYGNMCDADLNNDGETDGLDVGIFKTAMGQYNPDADFDGDGFVSLLDLDILKTLFDRPAGPSAYAP
jgi:hypothetical protein